MAKQNQPQKKVASSSRKTSSTSRNTRAKSTEPMLFEKTNYMWMLIGLGTVVLGFFLMSGGAMPDANTWEPDVIYSTRRITLAPLMVLGGLGIVIYAIFKRPKEEAIPNDQD